MNTRDAHNATLIPQLPQITVNGTWYIDGLKGCYNLDTIRFKAQSGEWIEAYKSYKPSLHWQPSTDQPRQPWYYYLSIDGDFCEWGNTIDEAVDELAERWNAAH